jgi:hypothetical protein
MARSQFTGFIKWAIAFAREDVSDLDDGPDAPLNLAAYRRIIRLGVVFGVLGFLSGIFVWIPAMAHEAGNRSHSEQLAGYVVAPLMIACAGILFGFSTGCLFASSRFFHSPPGQRLMRLLGADYVIFARIFSLVAAVLFGGLLVGPLIFLWFKN